MAVREQSHSASNAPSHFPGYAEAVLGLRNYWYPVMFSSRLGRRPVPVKLLGERIVLVRGGAGVHALHDRCPHRGVPLSAGRCEFPGTITCAYHGWTYDLASGDLVAVLTDGPNSAMCGKANVRRYPVAERAGLIWVFVGDSDPPPVEADIPEELLEPDTIVRGVVKDRRGNWRYAIEAGIDEGHAKYLHRRSPWFTFKLLPAWTEEVDMVPSEDGRWLQRLRKGTVFQGDYPRIGRWPTDDRWWKRLRIAGSVALAARLPCILRVHQGSWIEYECFVPVDEDHYRAVFLGIVRGSVLRRLWFHLWYGLSIRWLYHGILLGEDQQMIELMDIPPERLYRPDVSVTKWRQWCRATAREARVADEASAESVLQPR